MANEYEWENNPFQDFLLSSLIYGADITDKELEVEIYVAFTSLLEYVVPYSDNELELLDFEIKKRKGKFKVIGNNFISALWLSGIFPENPNDLRTNNKVIINKIRYKFNNKTKKLSYKSIKK
jgi:hypothetical protein